MLGETASRCAPAVSKAGNPALTSLWPFTSQVKLATQAKQPSVYNQASDKWHVTALPLDYRKAAAILTPCTVWYSSNMEAALINTCCSMRSCDNMTALYSVRVAVLPSGTLLHSPRNLSTKPSDVTLQVLLRPKMLYLLAATCRTRQRHEWQYTHKSSEGR